MLIAHLLSGIGPCVEVLLKYKADVNIRASNGLSPWDIAVSNGKHHSKSNSISV